MFDLAALAFGSFFLALSGALVPGPVLAATIAGAQRRGFWFGPGVIVGHALVELPVVALLVAGLAQTFRNPWVLICIGSVGAVALTWMGVRLVRQTWQSDDRADASGGLRLGAVSTGAVTSALNPYWYLWWVTHPTLLIASAVGLGWAGVAAFFVGHICADLGWYSLVSFGVARGRRFLKGRLYRGLLIVCALILFGMAALFAQLVVEQARGRAEEAASRAAAGEKMP